MSGSGSVSAPHMPPMIGAQHPMLNQSSALRSFLTTPYPVPSRPQLPSELWGNPGATRVIVFFVTLNRTSSRVATKVFNAPLKLILILMHPWYPDWGPISIDSLKLKEPEYAWPHRQILTHICLPKGFEVNFTPLLNNAPSVNTRHIKLRT